MPLLAFVGLQLCLLETCVGIGIGIGIDWICERSAIENSCLHHHRCSCSCSRIRVLVLGHQLVVEGTGVVFSMSLLLLCSCGRFAFVFAFAFAICHLPFAIVHSFEPAGDTVETERHGGCDQKVNVQCWSM